MILSAEDKREIHNILVWHSVAILGYKLDKCTDKPRFLGSGTLVKYGNKYGVLTAMHILDSKAFCDAQSIGITVSRNVSAYNIPNSRDFFEIIGPTRDRANPEWGPDMAIALLPKFEIGIIKAAKLFWALDKREINPTNGLWLVMGCPEKLVEERHNVSGFREVTRLNAVILNNKDAKLIIRGNYDYRDISVDLAANTDLPSSFKGLSGGGLWFIEKTKSESGEEKIGKPQLCGVAFYQTEERDNMRSIRCHGPISIYSELTKLLKQNG